MALKAAKTSSSPRFQRLTPPDSPTTGSATEATVEDLEHLFEDVLLDLTNRDPPNTPVFQNHSHPAPDMDELKQFLVKVIRDEYSSTGSVIAIKPTQSSSASNEQEENVHAVDQIDLESPICTTPDDFKSFDKWASKPQFKTVMEMYEPPDNHPFYFFR
jgi:hypothetical protein